METRPKKVVVGMSGGVDSSVAAILLKEQGYEVIGVTLDLLGNKDSNAILDARNICNEINIPHYVLDMTNEFKSKVIDYFANEYINGKTPNPCIICNQKIKFAGLIKIAKEKFDADYIATGHYAKILKNELNGRWYISEADSIKDQTYALCLLSQEELKNTLMPLGNYTKEDVRNIAKKYNLITAEKKDSQDICFVENKDYASFICNNYNYTKKAATLVDIYGKNYGNHKSIIDYTIGQRRGLGLSLKEPLYVKKIDSKLNTVYLAKFDDMFESTLLAKDPNFIKITPLEINETLDAYVKIRYSSKKQLAKITMKENNILEIVFNEPVKAITKGQMAVLYDDKDCLGGATII